MHEGMEINHVKAGYLNQKKKKSKKKKKGENYLC